MAKANRSIELRTGDSGGSRRIPSVERHEVEATSADGVLPLSGPRRWTNGAARSKPDAADDSQRGHEAPSRDPAREALPDRSMLHWTIAYLAAAWLILQLMDVLSEIWPFSMTVQRLVCVALGLGILPALVVAWFHGEKGRQTIPLIEVLLVGLLLLASGAVLWAMFGA